MKIKELKDLIKQCPSNAEIKIADVRFDEPCMFYVDGTYILGDFQDPPRISKPIKKCITLYWP